MVYFRRRPTRQHITLLKRPTVLAKYLTVIHAAATVQSDNPDLKKNEKLKKNGGMKKCYTNEGTQSDYRYVTGDCVLLLTGHDAADAAHHASKHVGVGLTLSRQQVAQ